MKKQDEFEKNVKGRLDEIKPVPPRNQHMASRGRAQFLSQAVSASESQRHNGWISKSRKEYFAMNTIIATLMIVGLLFGGGATVNAAQNELPNEPLYALKLWSEDIGLQLQNDPEVKVERLMDLAQIRLQEMIQLYDAGQPVPDQVRDRLDQHIQQALKLCTTMDDPTLERTLLQLRDRLQQQDRDMEQLQLHAQDQIQLHTQDQQLLLTQTRTMLHDRLQLVEDGLANQEAFRNKVQNSYRYVQDEELTPPVQDGNGQQNGQPTLSPNGPNTDPSGNNDGSGGNGAGGNESNTTGSGQNGK